MNTIVRRASIVLTALYLVSCMYLVLTDARAWNLWFAGFFALGAIAFYFLLECDKNAK